MWVDKKNKACLNPSVPGWGRIWSLDYSRIFVAFLVIYGHLHAAGVPSVTRLFIYSFHMPFFFIISGMLHKYNGTLQTIKYIRTLLVPLFWFNFFAWLIIVLFLYYGFWDIYKYCKLGIRGDLITTYYDVLFCFVKKLRFINDPTWFLLALFYCKIMLDFMIKKKVYLSVLMIIVCFILYASFSGHRLRAFYLGSGLMAFPFYAIGFFYREKILNMLTQPQMKWIVPFIIIAFVFLTLQNGKVTMYAVKFGRLPFPLNIIVFYLNSMIASVVILYISSLMTYKAKWVTDCANSLITILCTQYIFYKTCDFTIGRNLPFYITCPLSLLIYLLCYTIHRFINRFMPFVIGKT